MRNNVNRLLWIITLGFHLIMIFIIVIVLKSQLRYKASAETTATAVVAQQTSYAIANPPPTLTLTPPSTFTPSPPPTSTISPTATPIPCFADSTSNGIVYLQPSKGKTLGSIQIANASLPLYSRLQNENWWMTAIKNIDGIIVNGWINADSLTNVDRCATLETVSLEKIFLIPPATVYVAETFSTFDYEWLTSGGVSSDRLSRPGVSSLHIRSGNGQPVLSHLDKINLKGPFTFVTSLNRENFGRASYIGVRWTSLSDPLQFIELRIDANECSAIWINQDRTYPSIPLGSVAACGNDNVDDYLKLNYVFNNNTLQLSGEYNNASLPPLKISGSFDIVQLDLIMFDGDVEINYVLLAQNP